MAGRLKLLEAVRNVLADRCFTPPQIEKVVPRLHEEVIKEPKYLAEIIDTWNAMMNSASPHQLEEYEPSVSIPPMAQAPKTSLMGQLKIDMNNILADIEPDLLLFDPIKLRLRHQKLHGLGLANNLGEHWLLLYNAPRGFYMQDWSELVKKIYYIENQVIDFLYDKKEQRTMIVHPLVKSAAVTEVEFDHIRTRYLFAQRSGYRALSHMFTVQAALEKPTLKDFILSDNEDYLSKFAPFCSLAEYKVFSNLIKKNDCDADDTIIYEKLAELNSL